MPDVAPAAAQSAESLAVPVELSDLSGVVLLAESFGPGLVVEAAELPGCAEQVLGFALVG